MDIKALLEKIIHTVKKYRYAALVLIIGLVLMAIPITGDNAEEKQSNAISEIVTQPTLEEKLESVLSQINGAGEVRVILTIASGEQTIFQTNDDTTNSNESTSLNVDTVTVTDADKNQVGLVRQVNPATYQGAVIVCQGADDPAVQLAIVDAVSKLTGLGSNRISVLKMK